MKNNISLKQLIIDNIKSLEKKIKDIETNNYALQNKIKQIESIKKDKYNLVNIDINIIKEVISNFSIDLYDKEVISKYIEVIKLLLTLNIKKKKSYRISLEQKKVLDEFLLFLNEYKIKVEEEYIKTKQVLIETIYNYKNLLNNLGTKIINNLDLINQLFTDNNLQEVEKRKILYDIMKYNKKAISLI